LQRRAGPQSHNPWLSPGHKHLRGPGGVHGHGSTVHFLAAHESRVGSAVHITHASVGVIGELQIAGPATRGPDSAYGGQCANDRLGRAVQAKRAERSLAHIEALRHVVEHPLQATPSVLREQAEGDGDLEQARLVSIDRIVA